jgi:hypothetical protein
MNAYKRSRGTNPRILNLGNGYILVVNITPRPLYARVESSVPTQYEAGCIPEPVCTFVEKNPLTVPGFELWIVQPLAKSVYRQLRTVKCRNCR